MKRRPLYLLFLMPYLIAVNSSAKDVVEVLMPLKATVVGPRVTLGEVAVIGGANRLLTDRFRSMDLGRAASAGSTLKLTKDSIRMALKREGYVASQFELLGEETTEVSTQSQRFSTLGLVSDVKKFIGAELKEQDADVEVRLSGKNKRFFLPAGSIKVHFQPPVSGQYEGYTLLTAEIYVDGRLVRVLPLGLIVEVIRSVVVTAKRIERGEVFTGENVAFQKLPTLKVPHEAMHNLGDVLGKRASAALFPHVPVRATDLLEPTIIKRGQRVTLLARHGNIEVSVMARAIEDGKQDATIRVENGQSHKVVRAKVLNEKTVLIGEEQP